MDEFTNQRTISYKWLTHYCQQEDEEEDDDEEGRPAGVYRRLVFLANEGVVQTEVRGRNDTMGLQA